MSAARTLLGRGPARPAIGLCRFRDGAHAALAIAALDPLVPLLSHIHTNAHTSTHATTTPPPRFKTLDPKLPAEQRRQRQSELLREMGAATALMARALGPSHLLVQGAQRYAAQLGAMV